MTTGFMNVGTMPGKGSGAVLTLLLFGALLFVSSVSTAAADVRGDQFITAVEGNTLSGKDSAGSPFNLYFLPGGHVTYSGRAGTAINGTWGLDKDGDVCVQWSRHVDALHGCFTIAVDGSKVTWRTKQAVGNARLRGGVVDTFVGTASNAAAHD